MKHNEKLRQSEERFSKAFRSSPAPITICTTLDGRYVDVNEAFLRMIGCQREDVVGHTVQELKFWENLEDRKRMIKELERSGRVSSLETVFRSRSGARRLVQISAELIVLDGTSCVLAITNDITEAKALEEQLRHVQKMDAVGRLAGGIAHDFNNMLGIIIGYCDLAASRASLRAIQDDLVRIKRAAHGAVSLNRQLQTLSRQQDLRPAVINLNNAIQDLLRILSRTVPPDINLKFAPSPSLGHVKADAGQLEQVILNLVVNARDAITRRGSIVIKTENVELDDEYVKRHPKVRTGSYVMLSVSDTGCGMDSQTLSKIFEPFFTTKLSTHGTGLGLSIVYGSVQQAGGHIDVYSTPGMGTTFEVYFPRIVQDEDEQFIPDFEAPRARGTETVLLVEDQKSFRQLTRKLIESAGYKVFTAGDAQTALTFMKKSMCRIDALVTDIVLPGMRGNELAEVMLRSLPDLKVLYISSYSEGLADQPNLLKTSSFLRKPFTKQELLHRLRAVLDRTAHLLPDAHHSVLPPLTH